MPTVYDSEQKICLWIGSLPDGNKCIVTEEILATVMRTKEEGAFIRAHAVDPTTGKEYVFTGKHWFPCNAGGEDVGKMFTDAIHLYNDYQGGASIHRYIVDGNGKYIFPKGDVWLCKEHNWYSSEEGECPHCNHYETAVLKGMNT